MSSPGFSGGITEMTQVRKVRVAIRADGADYEGFVHLLEDGSRVQDVLNNPRPFLNLTEVVYRDRLHPYVALNKGAITHLMVMEVAAGEGVAAQPAVPGAAPGAAPALSAAAIAASRQPTVPPAGPATLPGPPPRPQTGGNPPTQPFPKDVLGSHSDDLDDDDLLLDEDDGDDIDPDDLERDVGALITGPGR